MIAISAETIGAFPSLRNVGLYHRRTIDGLEKDLVDSFIDKNLAPAPPSQVRLVFVEPRLETGFPDIVVVYLDTAAARAWNIERLGLGKREICALHHLATAGPQEQEQLHVLFPHGLRSSLAKLETAGLIYNVHGVWRALATKKLLAVRRIIAIEAKVDAWRSGLDQAFRNRWFASESYLLLPSAPKSPAAIEELRSAGVGLLTRDTPLHRPLLRALRGRLPGSYASWLFNEWACQVHITC